MTSRVLTPVMGLLLAASMGAVARAESSLLLDLSAGVALRQSVEHLKVPATGAALRAEVGLGLGHDLSAVGSLWWSRFGRATAPRCIDCPYLESLHSLTSGIALRYGGALGPLDLFVQAGPAYLVDLVDEVGGIAGHRSEQFHHLVFVGSAGVAVPISSLRLGVRFDGVLAGSQRLLGLGVFIGFRR